MPLCNQYYINEGDSKGNASCKAVLGMHQSGSQEVVLRAACCLSVCNCVDNYVSTGLTAVHGCSLPACQPCRCLLVDCPSAVQTPAALQATWQLRPWAQQGLQAAAGQVCMLLHAVRRSGGGAKASPWCAGVQSVNELIGKCTA